MDYEKNRALLIDLAEVAKKHGVTIMSGNEKALSRGTKHLEGHYMFFTFGERKAELNVGVNIEYQSSITLKISKNKFKSENQEDDGN